MGVTRFDYLPENAAQTQLAEARQVMIEQKGSLQPTSGANIRYYVATHSGEFAWSGRADTRSPQDPSRGGVGLIVTATATTSEVPMADLIVEVYTSTNGTSWSRWTKGQSMGGGSPYINYSLESMPGVSLAPREAKWFLFISALAGTRVAVKLQVVAVDDVTLSVERSG